MRHRTEHHGGENGSSQHIHPFTMSSSPHIDPNDMRHRTEHHGGENGSSQHQTQSSPQRERQPMRNEGQTMRAILLAVAAFAFGCLRILSPSSIPMIGNILNLFSIK